MTRANIEEDPASMARFLAGLNRQIQKVVELAHYVELENMVDMAIKIENQVKRRDSTNTRSEPSPISSTWKLNQWRKEDKPPNGNPKIEQEEEVTRQGNQDHESDCDSRPSLEDVDDKEYAVQGELMVARRALSVQAKEDDEVKRENIFHTRCHVQNKEFKYVIPEDDPGDPDLLIFRKKYVSFLSSFRPIIYFSYGFIFSFYSSYFVLAYLKACYPYIMQITD